MVSRAVLRPLPGMPPSDMPSDAFLRFESRFRAYLLQNGMEEAMRGGVLLALSGGMDSVLLLHLLSRLAAERDFSLLAVHVHHHLRGDEADRDAEFCRALCAGLSVPFELVHCDVPREAERLRRGVEETARKMRYGALRSMLSSRALACIATAHHANDHLETLLFQMVRGGGLSSLVGIRPCRAPLIRPLLAFGRDEIAAVVKEEGLSYVTDSTNADMAYARNYLRAEVVPRLLAVRENAATAAVRMSEGLAHDHALLEQLTDQAMAAAPPCDGGVEVAYLLTLHEALRRRVLLRLYAAARRAESMDVPLEHVHLVEISRLLALGKRRCSVAVPDELCAVCEDGVLSFCRRLPAVEELSPTQLCEGDNLLPNGVTVSIKRDGDTISVRCFSFLHKMDIMTAFSSAIINGDIYCRGRLPKDAYRFRGHTRLLKKALIEHKIPARVRSVLPILCDDLGILWVPFLPVRENTLCD